MRPVLACAYCRSERRPDSLTISGEPISVLESRPGNFKLARDQCAVKYIADLAALMRGGRIGEAGVADAVRQCRGSPR